MPLPGAGVTRRRWMEAAIFPTSSLFVRSKRKTNFGFFSRL